MRARRIAGARRAARALVGIALVLAGCPPAPSSPPAPLDPAQALSIEAERAWQGRADAGATERAIAAWESLVARGAPYESADALARLARAYDWLGEAHRTEAAARREAWARGKAHGERALELDATSLAAAYWTAMNAAHLASVSARYQQVFLFRQMEPLHRRVLERDERFERGGSHVFFGLYHAYAPVAFGGDRAQAYRSFDRALEIAPAHPPWVLLYLTHVLLRDEGKPIDDVARDHARAADLRAAALSSDPAASPDAQPEVRRAQAALRELVIPIPSGTLGTTSPP